MATDMTTLSALHKHITHATNAATLNLSGTLTISSATTSLAPPPPLFFPISIPLSIPSAVHVTATPRRRPLWASSVLLLHPPRFFPNPITSWSHFLGSNPSWVFFVLIKLDWVFNNREEGSECSWDLMGVAAAMRERETERRERLNKTVHIDIQYFKQWPTLYAV